MHCSPWGCKESDKTEATSMHTQHILLTIPPVTATTLVQVTGWH